MKKRVLSLLMAFALCLGLSVMAGAEENVAEVTVGDTTTQYTDIEAAFTAAQEALSPATVKLLTNVTRPITKTENYSYSYGIRLTSGNITLDLNGHTIQTTEVGAIFSRGALYFTSKAAKTAAVS